MKRQKLHAVFHAAVRRSTRFLLLNTTAAFMLAGCGGGDAPADVESVRSLQTPGVSLAQATPYTPDNPFQAAWACGALTGFQVPATNIGLPTAGAVVYSATTAWAGSFYSLPYCRVLGAINPIDPWAPKINFAVNLPVNWNGKAMQFGGGGFDGVLVDGSGYAPFSPEVTPLAKGYVTLGSDSGHSGSLENASFALNDEALRNYGGDAIKKTHDVAWRLMDVRYQRTAGVSYFVGASKGGQEALAAAQRWPNDYDGIVVTHPAWSYATGFTASVRNAQALYAPGGFINQNKAAVLYSSVLNACDSQDGVQDGLVSNPAACHFNVEALRCPVGLDLWDGCLSAAQITTVKTIASPLNMSFSVKNGISTYSGSSILSGANYGNYSANGPTLGFSPTPWVPATLVANPFSYVMGDAFVKYMVTRDPFFNSLAYDPVNAGAYQARVKQLSALLDASDSLGAFKAKGGKVLLAQGTADTSATMQSTIDYYQRVVNEFGRNATRDFMRFYLIPGFAHTDGAFMPAWNSVNALENWVEQGIAPAGLTVTDINAATAGRTRPLCEYPNWPRYNGAGYVSLASSFSCVQP